MVPRHRSVLRPFQHVLFVDADTVLTPSILSKALGCANVELATQRFDRDPERFVVQPIRRLTKVEGDLVVVGPSAYDGRCSDGHGSNEHCQ